MWPKATQVINLKLLVAWYEMKVNRRTTAAPQRPVAALWDSADTEHVHRHRKLYWTALVYCRTPSNYKLKYCFCEKSRTINIWHYVRHTIKHDTWRVRMYSSSNLRTRFCFGLNVILSDSHSIIYLFLKID